MEGLIKFLEAVDAIIESHESLYNLLADALEYYKPDATARPPRSKRISCILDCEANGAHSLIENLASAVKAVPRGSLGEENTNLLLAEFRDFDNFLDDHIDSPECAGIISDIRQLEESFINFINGDSGCDPNITVDEYSARIDKFVHDLKGYFRDLGHKLTEFECSFSRRRVVVDDKKTTLKRRVVRKVTSGSEDSVKAIRRKDTAAAVKEIRRRVKLGESYSSASLYLKRNPAWKVRLSHIKTETLVRYAKDKKRTVA